MLAAGSRRNDPAARGRHHRTGRCRGSTSGRAGCLRAPDRTVNLLGGLLAGCSLLDRLAMTQQLAGVITGLVGVADQRQGERVVKRLGEGSSRAGPDAVDQVPPSLRRRVALDTFQVVSSSSGSGDDA